MAADRGVAVWVGVSAVVLAVGWLLVGSESDPPLSLDGAASVPERSEAVELRATAGSVSLRSEDFGRARSTSEPITPFERPSVEQSSGAPADDLAALVSDLLDDDVRWNATRAVHRLRLAGPAAAPWLEAVLASRDRQQRQLAARVLWSFRDHYHPETAMAAVSALESSSDSTAVVAALAWLANHTETVRPRLETALGSSRGQARFYAAFLLARTGRTVWLSLVSSTLIEHLQDNRIAGDALMAAHALWRLGPQVLPYLALGRRGADRQALELLDLIELDIRRPPRTRAELEQRKDMHRITTIYHDPVVEYELFRGSVPVWSDRH